MAESTRQEIEDAASLMMGFADRTGLTGNAPPRRYLWTDAFGVCNFLGLAQATDDDGYRALALTLVDQVHRVLGTYRPDDPRTGWISGLGAKEGEEHPTRGGLRIGKPLPERGVSEPFDERLEWERDGQYFHYLTKWMHALNQAYLRTGNSRYSTWARELAAVAHDAFVRMDGTRVRMVWKMSTDLSRPLVGSMGHHDPLDGFITCAQLEITKPPKAEGPNLSSEAADFAGMFGGRDWATADPLGLGGLLSDASRVSQLMQLGAFAASELLDALLDSALRGLREYSERNGLGRRAAERLAFRELGLAIGLRAVGRIENRPEPGDTSRSHAAKLAAALRALARYESLGAEIRSFWLVPGHRETRTWADHRDINDVMLATSLVPDGFVALSATT